MLDSFSFKSTVVNFTKICLVETALMRTDGQTDEDESLRRRLETG